MADKGDFAAKLTQIGSNAYTSLGLALGSKLGLFDVLGQLKEPATSNQIASAAALKERYVREWLGIMVCSKIVEIDENSEKYWLPEERYKVIVGEGGMPVFLWSVPLICQVVPDILECFKVDGPNGVPYSKYGGFHEWRQRRTDSKYSVDFIHDVIGLVPGLAEKLDKGAEFCDIGCSTGHVVRLLAKSYPRSTIFGYDISSEAIEKANTLAREKCIANAKFGEMDLFKMPLDWSSKWPFLAVYDVIHDLPYPDLALREILRVIKPGGYFLMLDISAETNQRENKDHPWGSILYTMSLLHCMPVSLNFEGGLGLGTCWGRQMACKMIKEAGFDIIKTESRGIEEIYVCQKPE